MKKALLIFLAISLSAFSLTTQEIIDQGTVKQKEVFDRYFNTSENKNKSKKDANLLNKVYPEIIEWLYKRNKQIYDSELARLNKLKDDRRKVYKPILATYNGYINENSVFTRILLMNFLQNREDLQSYIYTGSYITLENFYLNMNIITEGEKNENTIEENVNTLINYLYHTGDSVTKEEYLKMSSSELKRLVANEFLKLDSLLDKKDMAGSDNVSKLVKTSKNNLKKIEKLYNKYDEGFDEYINTLNLKSGNKDKLRKLVKFEELSNLKFLIQSLETPKGEGK